MYSKKHDLNCSVLQGSYAGPVLYLAYANSLQDVIPMGMPLHGFADDHSVKKSFCANKKNRKLERKTIQDLEESVMKIKHWMDINWLKMNDGKTEFIPYGSRQQLLKCETASIHINGNSIERAKNLGVSLDKNLNMKEHVAGKCKTAMFNLLKINKIWPMLNMEACKTLMQGLVISLLDYSNAILAGLPKNIIRKLQRVQNIAAKIILNRDRSSVTECLKQLHRLPVRERIRHKTLTLVHKCLMGNVPMYLQDLLQEHEGGQRHLRSNMKWKHLKIPHTKKKTFAARSFSVLGHT